jgi:hypothetical protein
LPRAELDLAANPLGCVERDLGEEPFKVWCGRVNLHLPELLTGMVDGRQH